MNSPITIIAKAKQIEEIFFKDDAYDVFRSPATRKARRGFLWVAPVSGVIIMWASGYPNSGPIIGLAVTALIGQSILLGMAFHQLNKQRDQLVDFARSTEQAGPAELRLSTLGFSLLFKGAEHIERWVAVTNAVVADDHVFLRASTTYIFPRASMSESRFQELCQVVRENTFLGSANEPEKRPIGYGRQGGTASNED